MKSATPNFSNCPQAGKSKFLEPGASCYLLPLPFAWLLIQMHLDQMHLVHQSNSDSTMHQPYLAAIQSIICYFQSDNCSLKYGIILPLRDVEINSSHYEGRGSMHNIIMSGAVSSPILGITKPGACQSLKTQHNYGQEAQSWAEKSLCSKSRLGIVPRLTDWPNQVGTICSD